VAAMFVNGLEGEINVNEASRVLQKMNNNKSPGSDGFSTEFFKFFWIDLKSFVVNSINFGSLLGELSVTQNRESLHVYQKITNHDTFSKIGDQYHY
jgi:hypothetical protein